MATTKKETNVGTEPEKNDVQTPEGAQNGANQTTGTTEQKTEKLGWLKRHWKAVAGAIAAVVTIGGTGVVAYKKGKAKGIMEVPVPDDDGAYGPEE